MYELSNVREKDKSKPFSRTAVGRAQGIWLKMMQGSLAFYQERLHKDSVGKNI